MNVKVFRTLFVLYSWAFPRVLVHELRERRYHGLALLGWLWRAPHIRRSTAPLGLNDWWFVGLLRILMLAQISFAVWLFAEWARFGTPGTLEFGLALLLVYPIVTAHLLGMSALLGRLLFAVLHPKAFGRDVVCSILERQVRELRQKHHFTVVAVAGSIGKTSTKIAIAQLLAQTKRVRYQTGNYNDRVTVPLVFFGQTEPSLLNVFAWLKVFAKNAQAVRRPYPYDVVVLELGTDTPGQIAEFAYTRPDLAVVTAITPEHMHHFKTLDGVAAEELAIFDYSKQVLVNGDDTPAKYIAGREFHDYSVTSPEASYFAKTKATKGGQSLNLQLSGQKMTTSSQLLGLQGAKAALAAAAVAHKLGVPAADIVAGLPRLEPFTGRMYSLPGKQGTWLIDDAYNASPAAAKAALDVIYAHKAPQRIAILGSMNELGDYSPEAHQEVGAYCDPKKLQLVVTIGKDAEQYLAPAAEAQGCTVHSFRSPYEAGVFIAKKLQKNAVVLAKGSQNGVFAEEALKPLLANPADSTKLVRQSSYWLAKKRQQFPDSAGMQ